MTGHERKETGSLRRGSAAGGTLARIGVAGALALVVAGCGWPKTGEMPAYDASTKNGDQICRTFSESMQATSSKWAILAWVAGIGGTVASVVGGALGLGKDTDRMARRSAGVLLASLGGVLAATSAYSVSRSNAASDASAQATRARKHGEDLDKFGGCLDARADWLESRSSSLDHSPPTLPKKDDGQPRSSEHRD